MISLAATISCAFFLCSCAAFTLSPNAALSLTRRSQRMSELKESTVDLRSQIEVLTEQIEKLRIDNERLRMVNLSSHGSSTIGNPDLPEWFVKMKSSGNRCIVDESVREWYDEKWRVSTAGGFSGTDYIHSRTSAPVRIMEYIILENSTAGKELTGDVNEGVFYPSLVGPAYFSGAAESHKGLCHGGSMCALMDDAVGWMGFCISGKPRSWTGYTVQVELMIH